jgi:hypothetical protein
MNHFIQFLYFFFEDLSRMYVEMSLFSLTYAFALRPIKNATSIRHHLAFLCWWCSLQRIKLSSLCDTRFSDHFGISPQLNYLKSVWICRKYSLYNNYEFQWPSLKWWGIYFLYFLKFYKGSLLAYKLWW